METPSSTRRMTRSQTYDAANNCNITMSSRIEDSETGVPKSSRPRTGKQQDRFALIDISNDSPIVGLAMGILETPSSAMSKKRNSSQAKHTKTTPGSGEALLRGQVKTLLQKVAEISQNYQLVGTEIDDGREQEGPESEKSLISRSLLLDFFEKSDGSDSSDCSSVLTHSGGIGGDSEGKEKSCMEDEDASVWSIQVNGSTRDDDDDEEEEEEEDGIAEKAGEEKDEHDYAEAKDEEEEDDELCEGMSRMNLYR